MAHQLVITNGTIVDGTGAPPRRADLAVDNGRISRITESGVLTDTPADTRIDATDRLVTPGFVDVHTHLDAQIGWEPEMRPSSHHGVTTALIGNCGVTFAPVSKPNRRYLAELMEAVEDIAADAIMDGLPWSWESYGEYLDAVQELRPALNVVGLAGHSAIRFEAMGDRSMDKDAQPTDAELARITDLVRESLEGGAAGFSTSRFLGHRVPDGRCTPGTFADQREMEAIAEAIVAGGGPGRLFQVAPDIQTRRVEELSMFERSAELGCQVMFSGGTGERGDGGIGMWSEFLDRNNAAGRRITAIGHTRPSGAWYGLAQLCGFRTSGWSELMSLPTIADRANALNDPATKARLVAEAKAAGFSWGSPEMMHATGTGDQPDWDLDRRQSLAQIAADEGRDPIEVYVDRLAESEGTEFFNLWAFGGALENQWRYLTMDHVIPLLGDAGAHVGFFTDADSTTFLLAELTRNRGLFTLESAVNRITGKAAATLGLVERGEIREGWHGDLNVIDYDRLATGRPEYRNDFPHGGGRFMVSATGYDATIVGGTVVVRDGIHTGERPGQVIREFAHA
jgi:N-acyl-D-aspartate/D-glutamate deacylase